MHRSGRASAAANPAPVAIVHDYLTQRGGAERVVLAMHVAFPEAALYTSLYAPDETYPAFGEVVVHSLAVNRVAAFRRNHRLALPVLAPSFSHLSVPADVVFCSSTGWAHGAKTQGRKVVYCHSPARWLYQLTRYLGPDSSRSARTIARALGPPLRRWDRRAATSAHRYLANSTAVRDRIRDAYGIEAEVVPPPHAMKEGGPARAVPGLDPNFILSVGRLMPYKNVDAVVAAMRTLRGERLVVAGDGPERERLARAAGANVTFLGTVTDDELRWLYRNCAAVVAASFEDFGLTPLEAAAYGKPAAVLAWGGFLDTMMPGVTGQFFGRPEPSAIAGALDDVLAAQWDGRAIRAHAQGFSQARFVERLRTIAAEEASA